MTSLIRFWRDEVGGPLVEVAVLLPIVFLFLFASADFLIAFYQWTAATKAVEVGARLAAVSDPVATGLTGTTNLATNAAVPVGTLQVGDAMPDFEVTCNDASTGLGACTCTRGTCTGMGTYSAAAMNTIVFGRGSAACNDATSFYKVGMCDIFPRITAANVKIVYSQTGLGYAGRAAGPVPTITVSLQNLTHQFFFLNGFAARTMPPFATTITGEGLLSGAL
jgi:Flp pilus assembly protein TadG